VSTHKQAKDMLHITLAGMVYLYSNHPSIVTSNVEENIDSYFADTLVIERGLILNKFLVGDIPQRIFAALLARPQIDTLELSWFLQASETEEMLRRAIAIMPNLQNIDTGISMSESETGRIISVLKTSTTLREVRFYFGNLGDRMVRTFLQFVRELPSLQAVALSWARSYNDAMELVVLTNDSVASIFNGISECPSLQGISVLHPPPEDNVAFVATCLARAIAASSSVKEIIFVNDPRGSAFADKVCNALMSTDKLRQFDLCFWRTTMVEQSIRLQLERNAPWKPLLCQEVPLNYWPKILAKTNSWCQTSHHPCDALFLLIKEKNDVLLQNVHRGRIRKRKSPQLYRP